MKSKLTIFTEGGFIVHDLSVNAGRYSVSLYGRVRAGHLQKIKSIFVVRKRKGKQHQAVNNTRLSKYRLNLTMMNYPFN